MRAHLLEFAAANNLSSTVDGAGNVIIRRPGSGGGEEAPPVLLQAHMDMVPAAVPGSTHNFTADPIQLVLGSDGLLRANGTTLGADDGIGGRQLEVLKQCKEPACLAGLVGDRPSGPTACHLGNQRAQQLGGVVFPSTQVLPAPSPTHALSQTARRSGAHPSRAAAATGPAAAAH